MMNAHLYRILPKSEGDRIVRELQREQHLRPHQSLAQAVAHTRTETGFCPEAGQRALESLQIDPSRKIGRMRRSELAQLARTIYRLWQQALAAAEQTQRV